MQIMKPFEKKLTRAEVEAAADVLGARSGLEVLTPELVNSAFRSKLKESHPDTGGPVVDAATRVAQLKVARKTLLQWLEEAPSKDCLCRGTGFVPTGAFKTGPCPQCGNR